MRIVNIVTQLERGGAQAMALRLAEGFRERGVTAETWFLYEKSAAFADEPCVRTVTRQRPRSVWELHRTLRTLRRMVQDFGPDAVIGFTHYANVIGAAVVTGLGVPAFVATQHNAPTTYPVGARLMDYAAGALGFYSRNIHCGPAVLEAFGKYPRTYLDRSTVVPNGVRLQPSALSQQEAKRAFGLSPGTPVLAAVGRLMPQKNHQLLLHAVARHPEVALVVAGEGELRRALEDEASTLGVASRVHLPGEVDKARIADLLRAADVFVMPSLFEGLSVALIEALQEGLPIVSSDAPAQVHALTMPDGRTAGRLLSPHDRDGWSATVNELLGDEALRRELGTRAKERGADFDLDAMIDAYLNEIRGAVERHATAA